MVKLILFRGLPGSGKSTAAKNFVQRLQSERTNAIHIEADMYFMQPDGRYKFDATKVKEAHEWCQRTTKVYLNNSHIVCVSNTFTQLWEMQPYIDMTADPIIYRCIGNYKNIHNVPEDVIAKMRDRFEFCQDEVNYG